MKFKPGDRVKVEFAIKESLECGYLVAIGYTYCRECGGGGLVAGKECESCDGRGDHRISSDEEGVSE